MSNILGNLLKIALGAGVVYTVYKVGQSNGENKELDLLKEARENIHNDIDFITNLIKEHQDEPNKTRKNLDDMRELREQVYELRKKLENLK
jgi:peptidoglycan hydrolase CwlO-like protein